MNLPWNICLRSNFLAFEFRFIPNVVFRITHFKKRERVCKLFVKLVVIRYFEPVKDSTSNVCKRAISVVLKHGSFVVLGVSEKKPKKVEEDLQRISAQCSKNLVGKKARAQYVKKDKIHIFLYDSLYGYR